MDFKEWNWLNESRLIEANGELAIIAPAQTDWFNNPIVYRGLHNHRNRKGVGKI